MWMIVLADRLCQYLVIFNLTYSWHKLLCMPLGLFFVYIGQVTVELDFYVVAKCHLNRLISLLISSMVVLVLGIFYYIYIWQNVFYHNCKIMYDGLLFLPRIALFENCKVRIVYDQGHWDGTNAKGSEPVYFQKMYINLRLCVVGDVA